MTEKAHTQKTAGKTQTATNAEKITMMNNKLKLRQDKATQDFLSKYKVKVVCGSKHYWVYLYSARTGKKLDTFTRNASTKLTAAQDVVDTCLLDKEQYGKYRWQK